MCRDTWRIIQSFQLLVSHQIRPCFSVMVVCRLSYTCSTGTQVLGQFGETRLEYPKSCAGRHENQSKVLSSLFLINWDLTLVPKPSVGWAIPRSQVFRNWGNLGKLAPNTPNHMQEHMKSNPKSLDPYFTSIETLL